MLGSINLAIGATAGYGDRVLQWIWVWITVKMAIERLYNGSGGSGGMTSGRSGCLPNGEACADKWKDECVCMWAFACVQPSVF